MAGNFLPTSLQSLWSEWNIRGFVILGIFLQVLLASMAKLRKKTNNGFTVFVIWSAYFMADWAATFTFGLISNARCNNSNSMKVDERLLAFWAAFLLNHLGGPDTITAFSLEDNALWTRHLVGLVVQLFTFLYIFLKTLPDNELSVPTIMVAVAGAIKYGERTRALYLASMESLKKSTLKLHNASLGDSDDSLYLFISEKKKASNFLQIFKGLVVDIMPNHLERLQSREYILIKGAQVAFHIMEIELGLLYDMFYTKILALNSAWGLLSRTIAYYNVVVALVLYCLSKKEGFHEVDVRITFFLLAGVLVLDTFSEVTLLTSDWSRMDRWYHCTWLLAQGICFIIPGIVVRMVPLLFEFLFRGFVSKYWRKKLGAFNLLSHCFRQCRHSDNKLKKYAGPVSRFFTAYQRRSSWNAFNYEIKNFIFNELTRMALFAEDADKVKTIFETRGGWNLMKSESNRELMRYVHHFDYDRSLLVWHIATEICYNNVEAIDAKERKRREFAKILSDYMNYLLIEKSAMMSVVAGIGHIRYRDTCTEITRFCRLFKFKTVDEFCTKVVDEITSIEPTHEYSKQGASVLSDACNLAKALRQKDKKWEIISRVWVEVLMYAAGHCRPEKHARELCQGGELVTIVWLLMAHLGIGPHFPYPVED